MKHLRILALSSALGLGLATSARPALADAPSRAAVEEGRTHFKRGVALFKEADFRAALIEFEKAFEIAPNFRVQYNIGQTCLELQDYACALGAFQRYLKDGEKEVPPARRKDVEARRKDVEKEVTRLAALVAHVRVSVNREGAEVSVDDISVGKSPLPQALAVGAGRHKFTATLSPSAPVNKVVDIASGDDVEVKLELEGAAPAQVPDAKITPVAPPVVAPPPPHDVVVVDIPSRAPFFVGVASTAVLTGGTIVFGLMSIGAKSSLDRKIGELGVTPGDVESAQSKVKTFTILTDVVGGAAIVAGVVTTILFFTTSPSSHLERRQGRRLTVTPLGVAGSF
ncbi:MAG: PEGA domain-containing protein [Polyangiaceae bacterium]|nr:PEGA domain-containing protein [Polyangiaceae bacterium]